LRRHVAVVFVIVGLALSGCATTAVPRSTQPAHSEGITARPLPGSHAGSYLVSTRTHSAEISGYTWSCMTAYCPPAPSTVELLLGAHLLAKMKLSSGPGWEAHFRFYLSNLPASRHPVIVSPLMNSGVRRNVRVVSGLSVTVPLQPVP
jgi:hypothetical protein